MASNSSKERKTVYTITERDTNEGTQSFFTRIGVGFVNKDGSINVILEALPCNGRLQIRDYVPPEARQNAEDSDDRQQNRKPASRQPRGSRL